VYVEQYDTALNEENLDLLIRVARDRNITGYRQNEVFRLAHLFDHHFILSYRNDERWFDLHPLVRRTPKLTQALRKSQDNGSDGTR